MTLGEFKAKLNAWAKETIDPIILTDSINDAVESLWTHIMIAQVESFMGGPTTFAIAAASERFQLTSVADPLVPLVVNQVAGGALGNRNLQVAYTLVTESGSETNLSPLTPVAIVGNFLCAPPPPAPNAGALGWNLYAGSTAALMCQQNKVPLAFSGPVPNEPDQGWKDAPNGGPLPPTENTTADNIFYIRDIQVALTGGGYKSWSQADITSTLFKRAQYGIASTSEFQNYCWDLLNGRQLEIRPALGTNLSPRYFFVNKPRRLRFDQAQIPLYRFPCEAYLRAYCLSNIALSNTEFDTDKGWTAKADSARAEIIKSVLMMNHNKDLTVSPFMR